VNFFEHQEAARRNTRVMVLLYALAVVAVVLAVDLVLGIAFGWASSETQVPRALYVWGALGTAAAILLVSLYRIMRLSAGGKAVAEMIGAAPVPPDTRDPLERRLLNVVEEMAIAAGTRVPAVYVMREERGINAFAAGYDVSNTVIAVTRTATSCRA
jgi:Zn-dependent protease with chaperone function